ncbi:hypothetical protein MTO96_024944 [Rhipicephalus appendiculatus]
MQKILDWQGKTLSLKTGFSLSTRVIDVLENVRNKCIEADMESPKLLPAFGKDNENKVYIMDCGPASSRVEAPALARTRI